MKNPDTLLRQLFREKNEKLYYELAKHCLLTDTILVIQTLLLEQEIKHNQFLQELSEQLNSIN
jgi:hypothetical protein